MTSLRVEPHIGDDDRFTYPTLVRMHRYCFILEMTPRERKALVEKTLTAKALIQIFNRSL